MWKNSYVATGEIDTNKQLPRESMSIQSPSRIANRIGSYCTSLLKEIYQYIHSTSGVNVFEPMLCRILRKYGLTRKKIRQEAIQHCSMLRGHLFG